jgi:AcrR family transcriptional regulator
MVVSSATSESVPVSVRPRGRKNVHHLGVDDRSSTRIRIVDATLRCLARQGMAKTTIDEIAREAKLSRATLYRTFPGGKEAIVGAVAETEVARLFSSLAVVMGEAVDLEDVLVAGMVESARQLSTHPALAYQLAHEPGVILRHLTFADLDNVLFVAGDFAAPFFAGWLSPDEASRAAEWAVRIVLAYSADPAPDTDLADPDDTRALVRTFVMPGILALRAHRPATDAPPATDAADHSATADSATPDPATFDPTIKEAVR